MMKHISPLLSHGFVVRRRTCPWIRGPRREPPGGVLEQYVENGDREGDAVAKGTEHSAPKRSGRELLCPLRPSSDVPETAGLCPSRRVRMTNTATWAYRASQQTACER